MKEDISEITTAIKQWIEENREHLPVNIDNWKIQVYHNEEKSHPKIEWGKYDAGLDRSVPFYKPYSKIVYPESDVI